MSGGEHRNWYAMAISQKDFMFHVVLNRLPGDIFGGSPLGKLLICCIDDGMSQLFMEISLCILSNCRPKQVAIDMVSATSRTLAASTAANMDTL